jgi:hypothetical protein
MTEFNKKKRKAEKFFFKDCLKAYIHENMGSTFQNLGIDEDTLLFHLGALVYPKEMIKMLGNDQKKVQSVLKVYNYLHKFSLERL